MSGFENSAGKHMVLVIYSFTDAGSRLNAELCRMLEEQRFLCKGYCVARFASQYGLQPLPPDWKEQIGDSWGSCAVLFIGAAGIAVRTIAPFVRDKFTDSPVLVIDERCGFVVPLLSGHVGGAVELANVIADCTGAAPVITTATDVQKRFAVDVFARKNQLFFDDREVAKRISAGVLEGEKVGLFSSRPVIGRVPEDVELCERYEDLQRYKMSVVVDGAFLSGKIKSTYCLSMVSQDICAGIGCRRGVSKETLLEELEKVLKCCKISRERIFLLASIDLKKEEPGILALQRELQVPFQVYRAEELAKIESVSPGSAFVERMTGVDNVCERAARAACPDGNVIQPKICMDRCTFAFVQAPKREITF